MSLLPANIYRSAFAGGLSQGLLLPFAGCLVITFFSSSVLSAAAVIIALSLAGGAVLGLARRFSETEEWNELNRDVVQKEFDKEQRILEKIGIPDRILQPMQQQMTEEQRQRIRELPASLPVYKPYKAGLCLFTGYCISGGITALFLYISDMHLVISAVMLLGVKFAAELYLNIAVRKVTYPVLRTLLNIFVTALIFVTLHMLLKGILL